LFPRLNSEPEIKNITDKSGHEIYFDSNRYKVKIKEVYYEIGSNFLGDGREDLRERKLFSIYEIKTLNKTLFI
jgi:hypothetical protein